MTGTSSDQDQTNLDDSQQEPGERSDSDSQQGPGEPSDSDSQRERNESQTFRDLVDNGMIQAALDFADKQLGRRQSGKQQREELRIRKDDAEHQRRIEEDSLERNHKLQVLQLQHQISMAEERQRVNLVRAEKI